MDFIARRYTGQIQDPETGLYYYNARYYDPTLGRFLSPDSIVPNAGDPQALNRYSYVRNNPIRSSDPSGHGDGGGDEGGGGGGGEEGEGEGETGGDNGGGSEDAADESANMMDEDAPTADTLEVSVSPAPAITEELATWENLALPAVVFPDFPPGFLQGLLEPRLPPDDPVEVTLASHPRESDTEIEPVADVSPSKPGEGPAVIGEFGKDMLEAGKLSWEGVRAFLEADYNMYKASGEHRYSAFEKIDWNRYDTTGNFEDAFRNLYREGRK